MEPSNWNEPYEKTSDQPVSYYHEQLKNNLSDANDWEYVGGNSKPAAINRWKLRFKDRPFPSHSLNCVCTHDIKENCYIYSKTLDEIRILGNCCIKKYYPDEIAKQLNCSKCGAKHKSRKVNMCKDCQIKQKAIDKINKLPDCEKCGVKHRSRTSDMCKKCRSECIKCDKYIGLDRGNETDGLCWSCYDHPATILFGKYRGSSFYEVFETDKKYCTWVMNEKDCGGNFLAFQKWLKHEFDD